MKADLHFHPSFFSRGDKPHFTERKTPSLDEIIATMYQRELELITITSCSTSGHIDKRWDAYLNNLDKKNLNVTQLSNQGLFLKNNSNQIYLIHGQELQTNKGDINVLFAEKRVPIEKSKGDIFYILDAAKDQGENVLIGINQVSKCSLTPNEIRELYEKGKIDFLESYNSFDFPKNNKHAENLSQNLGIPGIAVSDGHRLKDLGEAYIKFNSDKLTSQDNYNDLGKEIKELIKTNNFTKHIGSCSNFSRFLYLAKMSEHIIRSKL